MVRSLLWLALLALSSSAFAQPDQRWTLQSAAFGNAASAAAAVNTLRTAGFDAYSESSGALRRVRIGCFLDRTSAEDVAAHLARQAGAQPALGQHTEVQVVPLSTAEGPTFCVRRDAGFLLPDRWGIVSSTPQHITFWVDAAGRRYLRFGADGWRVYQSAASLEGVVSNSASSSVASETASTPIVQSGLVIGTGRPLWRLGSTVVVHSGAEDAAVVTLTVSSPLQLSGSE